MFELANRRRRGGRGRRRRNRPHCGDGQNTLRSLPGHPPHQATSTHRSSCSSSTPASHGDQQMNPIVAKLLRGESLPMSPHSPQLMHRFNEMKSPAHYREQIQYCVANPGRFLASWAMLVTLFGEARLYDFVRESAWNEAELKRFIIEEDSY